MIAVNSGSSLSKVTDYAKKNKIFIPMIADTDRSLEKSAGLRTEISLKNIWQARIVKTDGTIVPTSASKLDEAMAKAVEGASWNLDPADVPASMKSVWMAVEFGSYATAAKPLAKFTKSRKREEKAAAKILNDYIEDKLSKSIADAERDLESSPYSAWKKLTQIKASFGAYKLPKSVTENLASLRKNEKVETEQLAQRALASAVKAARGNSAAQKRAVNLLKRLIEKYPDTEAATEAQQLLTNTTER